MQWAYGQETVFGKLATYCQEFTVGRHRFAVGGADVAWLVLHVDAIDDVLDSLVASVRLDRFDDGAGVRPDLDLSVFASCVAPALLIEANGSKICHLGVLSESSLLLESLGNVCWMPEFDFFHADRGEAEVVSALRPGEVDDLFFRSFNVEKLLCTLDVVNSHSVVVMKVNTGDVAAAW